MQTQIDIPILGKLVIAGLAILLATAGAIIALTPSEQDKYDKWQKELDQVQADWRAKENEQNILHAKAEYIRAELLSGVGATKNEKYIADYVESVEKGFQ